MDKWYSCFDYCGRYAQTNNCDVSGNANYCDPKGDDNALN